jgi:RNA polymerase sigma-70 factor, ECF subfamily
MLVSVFFRARYTLGLQTVPIGMTMARGTLTGTSRGLDFSELYREHGARLWRAVFAFTRDRAITDDAVSEAFAQCIRRGDEVANPKAWVWRASFRIAAGALKERGRWAAMPQEPSYEIPEEPSRLLAALDHLSANERASLVLRHYTGYETKEIATILGIAPATVRVHLSRGRRKLRPLLEEDTDEGS